MTTPETEVGQGAAVVGFDGSEHARQAVFWAAHEAARRQCPLVVVTAVRGPFPRLLMTPVSAPLPEMVSEEAAREFALSELEDVAAECRKRSPELDVRTHLADGHPAAVLHEVGQDAELLVLGPSGHTGLSRVLLGSVAADLMHTCDRPVVVVRNALVGDGPVVIGVDGSETSKRAVDFAIAFAARHGSDLVAVRSWTDLPVEAMALDYDWRRLRAEAETVIDKSIADSRERYPDVHVERVVSFDAPAVALLEQAKDATLLVVGSHGRGAVRRALLGSVSHAVLYHAPCSVAVVRGHR